MAAEQEQAMVCPECGSTFFQDAQFNQYRTGAIAAIPVIETFEVAETGPWIRICLCGHPIGIPPGKTSVTRANRASFEETWQNALAYRAVLTPDTMERAILQQYATRGDAQELYHKLSRLLDIVDVPEFPRKRTDAHAAGKEDKAGRKPRRYAVSPAKTVKQRKRS